MEGKTSKRSDEQGKGRTLGTRKQVVIAVLLGLSLVIAAVYLVQVNSPSVSPSEKIQPGTITSVSTTGILCNDSSMPQTAQGVEQEPAFTSLSGGLCYNYLGLNATEVQGADVLSFGYFNGTVVYPCGVSPLEVPQSVILDTVYDGQTTGELQSLNSSAISQEFYPQGTCPSVPVEVVSVADAEALIPAVPELNLTISSPVGSAHVTSLTAIVALDGGYQQFEFKGLSATNPLPQGEGVSAIEIVTGPTFSASQVYPMTLDGTLSNGQTFSYGVQVQITGVEIS